MLPVIRAAPYGCTDVIFFTLKAFIEVFEQSFVAIFYYMTFV